MLPMKVAVMKTDSTDLRGRAVWCLNVDVAEEHLAATVCLETTATRRVLICDEQWLGGRLRLTSEG